MSIKEGEKFKPMSAPIGPVLRDLEVLLQRKLGNNLIVDSFTTSSLVSPGENYGSTMLKVDAEVRHDGPESESKKLSLIAKMVPPKVYRKMLGNSSSIFRKEVYMYTEILHAYKVLESECGIPETEVFDLFPKFYGFRCSLEEGAVIFDDDAVILMENLKLKNYACGDRTIGFDLAHANSVVEALARFHVLGTALKIKKPELFEKFKVRATLVKFQEGVTTEMARFVMSNVKKIPNLLPYLNRIENALFRSNSDILPRLSLEPWGTLIHADLTITNVMFRDDANGNPEDVKIIDYQNYRYQNPLQDLVFLLFTSCKAEVRIASIEDLIDLYYQKFISHLAKLKCDVNLFSRDSFNEQLAYAANLEYMHCAFMSRIIPMDANREADLAVMLNPQLSFKVELASDEYREQLAEISLRFIKENWI